MFVTLVDEKAQTSHVAILIARTHDNTKATLYVFYPEFASTRYIHDVPNVAHAFVNSEGKHPYPYFVDAAQPTNTKEEEVANA